MSGTYQLPAPGPIRTTGTFTPAAQVNLEVFTPFVLNSGFGSFRRIGDVVYFVLEANFTKAGAENGSVIFHGMPFNISNGLQIPLGQVTASNLAGITFTDDLQGFISTVDELGTPSTSPAGVVLFDDITHPGTGGSIDETGYQATFEVSLQGHFLLPPV